MTESLGHIDMLRRAMNNLYPMVESYYKIKEVVKQLEMKDSQ